jgi:superfamily I DNA and RNA helicase
MLNLVVGYKNNPLAANQLIELLDDANLNGTLYIGYPVLADVDETVFVDALLTTKERGIVVIDFDDRTRGSLDDGQLMQRQDDLYRILEIKLKRYKNLVEGRRLPFEINVITLVPRMSGCEEVDGLLLTGPDSLLESISNFPPLRPDLLEQINAAIERVTTIKPTRKRSAVKRPDSRGARMKEIEKEIANLDKWQNSAAVEMPEGVQRIRGLAGSGKTIVLALKAAYLHVLQPEWKITITFQTRALHQQFVDLVRRFTFDQINDEPNWENFRIIHAWGGPNQAGFYSEVAQAHGFIPKDFNYAKNTYGVDMAFDGVCQELLKEIGLDNIKPLFDVVLIDEAQDFPPSFFELAYLATTEPKRIVYAYDELQNLSRYSMVPPSELFGSNPSGTPRVPELLNQKGSPSQDIVLPVCYRNTPWALTIAHALGFGIKREQGLVQYFNDSQGLWEEIGYQIVSGQLSPGKGVSLKRRLDSYPDYFEQFMDPADAILCEVFPNNSIQAKAVAKAIQKNLTEDELEFRDILIILPDPLTAQEEASILFKELSRLNIPAHLAGVTSSRDELFKEESIAITGIYRAKGNEAPMVYVLNSEYAFEGLELSKRRNIIFTAITRSKAWVRLFGCGPAMEGLKGEVNKVVVDSYHLKFRVPTIPELERLRKIHRDRTTKEREKVQKMQQSLVDFVSQVHSGDIAIENLPLELQSQLKALFEKKEDNAETKKSQNPN